MIECATLDTLHHFNGNPISEQHKLRYRSIIKRQGWDIPVVRGMEYDQYDNPASYYLVVRGQDGSAIGSSRLYPTDRPYMLQESFSHLVSKTELPHKPEVWEGSRFCIDSSLPALERRRIMQELVVGYLEFGLDNNISSIIGVMFPIYWKNIFFKAGVNIHWLGELHKSEEGHKIIAGEFRLSQEVLDHVREVTGIKERVLSYGNVNETKRLAA